MIRFKTGVEWTDQEVAARVSRILTGPGDDWQPLFRDDKWQLETNNDWFMSKVSEHHYEVRFRYGRSREQMLDGLGLFLNFVFGEIKESDESTDVSPFMIPE